MLECQLLRGTSEEEMPQIGLLVIRGSPHFITMEPPWRNNRSNVSCIPEGEYFCRKVLDRVMGHRRIVIPVTFEVMDVPNRYGILFHAGNQEIDTEGCIIVGQTLFNPKLIGSSKVAFQKFLKLMEAEDKFRLTIKNP